MRIYNTMTGQKEDFSPARRPGQDVRLRRHSLRQSHVGHAMSYIVFDTIRRYLEYRGYNVHIRPELHRHRRQADRARRAARHTVKELAEKHIADFIEDMATLNVGPPTSTFARRTRSRRSSRSRRA